MVFRGKGSGSEGGSSKAGPTKDNLAIAQQLSALMTSMATQADRIARSYESQAAASAQIAQNMQSASTGDSAEQFNQMNASLREVVAILQEISAISASTFQSVSSGVSTAASSAEQLAVAAQKTKDSIANIKSTPLQDLRKQLGKTGKDSLTLRKKLQAVGEYLEGEFPVAAGAAVGALSGLKQGFSNLVSLGSSLLGMAGGLISSLWEIGKSIVSIPFQMLDGLTDMAEEFDDTVGGGGGGGINEYAEALNELKGAFGDLNGPLTTAIQNTANLFKGAEGLANMFGKASDRMKMMTKTLEAGGIALQTLHEEFNNNGGAITVFQHGLGFSDEELGNLAKTAITTGKPMSKHLLDITKQATHLGKAFGVDFKILSKGMAKANSDMAHFGGMSQKQIGVAVTYFAKLGVELDKVTGTMDAFSTFDEAADKVSTLNEVFSMNIDAMELVNAENPAETIEILRKEFAKAGQDGEKFSRAQRKLLKDMLHMDDATVMQTFSSKNRGVALDKIAKEGEKAEKSALTQSQAMNKLAGSIMKVNQAAGGGGGAGSQIKKTGEGFMGQVKQGLLDGITHTEEFQKVLRNLRDSLRAVYDASVRLGAAFVQYFPGVKDFLDALGDIFEPEKFSKFANSIVDELIQFMKDLGEPGGKASFADLMDRLKEKFFDFFDANSGAGTKLVESFGKIMDAIKVVLAGAIKWIMEMMGNFIKDIVNFIRNPEASGANDLAKGAQQYVSPIVQAFKEGWKVLGPALEDLVSLLFEKLLEILKKVAMENYGKISLILFGPMFAKAMMGAATAAIGSAISKAITKAFTGPDVQEKMLKSLEGINEKLAKAPSAADTGGKIPDPEVKKLKKMETKLKWSDIKKFLFGLAGVLLILGGTFAVALIAIRKFEITTEEIAKVLLLVGGMSLIGLALGVLLKTMKGVTITPETVKGLVAIGAVAIALAVIGGGIAMAIKGLEIKSSHVMTMLLLVGGMTIIAGIVGLFAIGLIALGSAISNPASIGMIVAGIVGIGVITAAIAVGAYEMVKSVKDAGITGDDVKLAGAVIGVAVEAIKAAVLATGAALTAGVIGLVSGLISKLTGGKVDIFASLQTIVDKVAECGMGIVNSMKGVNPEMAPVIDAFSKLLTALGTIMKIVPDTIKALDFSWWESSKDQSEKIKNVTEMIKKFIGSASGEEKVGVVGLMATIIDGIKGMNESDVAKAQAIGPILSGVAGIMQAMASGVGPISEISKHIDDDDFEKVAPIVNSMGKMMDTMAAGVAKIVEKMKPLFEEASKIPEGQAGGVQALAALMQAIGPIAQAMQLPPGVGEALTAATKTTFGENAGDILKSLGDYMAKVSEPLAKKVIPAITGGVKELISALKGGGTIDPGQAEVLKAIGPILSTMVNFVSSLSDTMKGAKDAKEALGMSTAITLLLASLGASLPKIFDAISQNIGTLINKVIEVLSTVKVDASTKGKIEYLSMVFGVIDTITKLTGAIKPEKWENNLSASDGIVSGIARIAIFLGRLVGPGKAAFGTSKAPLTELLDNMQTIVKSMGGGSELSKGAVTLKETLDNVKSITETLQSSSQMPILQGDVETAVKDTVTKLNNVFKELGGETALEMITSLGQAAATAQKIDMKYMTHTTTAYDNMTKIVESFGKWYKVINPVIKDSYKPQIEAMGKMIDAIAEIDGILSSTQNIKIADTLNKFTGTFGLALGKSGKFAVKAKDVVINVSFDVKMETKDIETAIIESKDGKIKKSIQTIYGAFADLDEKAYKDGTAMTKVRSAGNDHTQDTSTI